LRIKEKRCQRPADCNLAIGRPRRRELHLVRFEALDGACLSLHGRSQRQPYRRLR
jgi:hypothetical protein